MTVYPVPRWRDVLAERTSQAVHELAAVDGVVDVVVGGSIGRGEPWPLSDIDVLPIAEVELAELRQAVVAVRHRLERDWARVGIPQNLDVGTLAFGVSEVQTCLDGGVDAIADRVTSPHWLFGSDKAAGGRGLDGDGLGSEFGQLCQSSRFTAVVRRARFDAWMNMTGSRLAAARELLRDGKTGDALVTAQVAGPLSAALLETWGYAEGGMTRGKTRLERLAEVHDTNGIVKRLDAIAGSSVAEVLDRVPEVPAWLEARIELARLARREVEEPFDDDQNRRDQILLHLGHPGMPTYVEWMLDRVADPSEFVERVEEVRSDIRQAAADRF